MEGKSDKSLEEFLESWSGDDDDDVEEGKEDSPEEDSIGEKFFEEEDESEEESMDDEDEIHVPQPLEPNSDESDDECESEFNKNAVESWVEEASGERGKALAGISKLAKGFKKALNALENDGSLIEGAEFNSVVRACLATLPSALVKYLKSPKDLKSSPNWSRVNKTLKGYLEDLVKFLSSVSDPSVIAIFLKHIHSMLPFYALIPKASKILTKELIIIWSSSDEETSRILAFMCILRMAQKSLQVGNEYFEFVIKAMYMAYVKNCKFTSVNTLSGIVFMRKSLAELMNLNQEITYQHAFIYIRQLAIHLRNELTLSKESVRSVNNWQFLHALDFWATLLGTVFRSQGDRGSSLRSLVYPLVQVITGFVSSAYISKYYPLRFHVCKILMKLSRETGKFIPVLPYYMDVLLNSSLLKASKKLSMKRVDFTCILKCTKAQLLEKGFKDETVSQVYAGLIELFGEYSHKINFPELSTPAIFALKTFLKKCKIGNYSRKIKHLLEKIEENAKWIEMRRKKVTFNVGNSKEILAWEAITRAENPPMHKFYLSWKKVADHEKLRVDCRGAKPEKADFNFIPSVKQKKVKKERYDFKGDILEGDDDGEETFVLKEERKKRPRSPTEETDEPQVNRIKPHKKKRKFIKGGAS